MKKYTIFTILILLVFGSLSAVFFLIQAENEQKLFKKLTEDSQSLNTELVQYDISPITTENFKKSYDLNKELTSKKNTLSQTKENVQKQYSLYKDTKVKEYSYIPELKIDKFLPENPSIEVLKKPQSNFNYDIAQKEIENINFTSQKYYFNSFDSNEVISKMTLEDKVKQMFMWYIPGTNTSDYDSFLKKYKSSGVVLLGDNVGSNLKSLLLSVRKTSTLPSLISIDQEGGTVKRISSDTLPYSALLKNQEPQKTFEAFESRSKLLQENTVNLNFGIVADVTSNQNSFIYPRVFGGDFAKVATLIEQAVKGSTKTLTTLKHFPGHGRTAQDSHLVIPNINISFEEWKSTDALPFISGINAGADFVMFGHLKFSQIDSEMASLSKKWHEILRNDLKFKGVIITDSMTMLETSGHDPYDSALKAVQAGNDILLYVGTKADEDKLISTIVEAVKSGKIDEKQINESVVRILEMKKKTLFL